MDGPSTADSVVMAEPPLMASAGALGDEAKKTKKRKKEKKDRHKSRAKPKSATSQLLKPPAYDESPLSEKSNLAGRIDYYLRSPLGVKRKDIKVAKPFHQVNLTTEPFITFVIQSNKNEFIRFRNDSLTVVYYATYSNPNINADVAAGPEARAERWALRAASGRPRMFVDPCVMGAGFFHRVEVLVDNVPCLSNSDLNSMHLQYLRTSRIFTDKPPTPYFVSTRDFDFEPGAVTKAMKLGMEPFDAATWNSTQGYRMPVYLDGYFPFGLKNRTLESIDKRKEPNLFFPPDTTITIKLHTHRTKMESIFHPEVARNMTEYFNPAANIDDINDLNLRFALPEAILEYESVQLHPLDHADVIKAFRSGGSASYNYDRVACQHTALMPNLTLTENRFQIPPHARLIYVLFLPDYATFNIEAMRRPLSGFSRFPANCTNMSVSFAGEENLIHDRLENFGIRGQQVEASKRIYWKSLINDRMLSAKFHELFPKTEAEVSLIQALCLNMRNHISNKVETLTVRTEFAGALQSPDRQQVVVMSVHPTGALTCQMDQSTGRWNWQFGLSSFA